MPKSSWKVTSVILGVRLWVFTYAKSIYQQSFNYETKVSTTYSHFINVLVNWLKMMEKSFEIQQ